MSPPPASTAGAAAVTLRARDLPAAGPAVVEATVLPHRGMMLLQTRLRSPGGEIVDGLYAPSHAIAELNGGPDDFIGNKSFSLGGALLIPYANRIRGRDVPGAREIETTIAGRTVRLPRNWGGKAPGAEQYAMHGLILEAHAAWSQPAADTITATLEAGDFGGRWPGRTRLDITWRLAGGGLELSVVAANVGEQPTPIGIGWHPYFALPSGNRRQARLHVPATQRVEVADYDAVLPTGRLLPVAGTAYDFNAAQGVTLGELYLDDCFTDLQRQDGRLVVEVHDPAAGVGMRLTSASPQVKAVQVYAPPDQAFVVVEPQFNLADPYRSEWPAGADTGMTTILPGASVAYDVRLETFALGTRLSSEG